MNAWDLFQKTFKEGEEIFVISEYDTIYWGKLKYAKGDIKSETFFLTQLDGSEVELYWRTIRFFSHDGFPVWKLKGADGSVSIEKIDTTNTQKTIAILATQQECPLCNKLTNNDDVFTIHNPKLKKDYRNIPICSKCRDTLASKILTEARDWLPNGYTLVFGDPFLLEASSVKLFNQGNSTPEFWDCHPLEECLLLSAKDSARAIIYDIPTIYYLN